MFRESRIRLQTIHYIHATKGEITGMTAHAMVILSIQVAMVGVKILTCLGGKRYSDEIGLPIQQKIDRPVMSCASLNPHPLYTNNVNTSGAGDSFFRHPSLREAKTSRG